MAFAIRCSYASVGHSSAHLIRNKYHTEKEILKNLYIFTIAYGSNGMRLARTETK